MKNQWQDRGDHFAVWLWWPTYGNKKSQAERLGLCALVDAAGLALMQAHRGTWTCIPDRSKQTYYVRANVKGATRRRDVIWLHRLVTGCPVGLEPDHRNHDGLDNRPNNLTIGTHAQNLANRRPKRIL